MEERLWMTPGVIGGSVLRWGMPIDPFMLDGTSLALARAIHHHGLTAPSLRQIASEMNTVPGTLLHHFGTKERLLTLSADRLAERAFHALRSRVLRCGWDGFVPDGADADDVFLTRARLGLAEIGRHLPPIGPVIRDLREQERELVWSEMRDTLASETPPDDVRVAVCGDALLGLWEEICSPDRPITASDGRERWATLRELVCR